MAANRGNTPKRRKISMAEELMSMVTEEEYADIIAGLTDDEYITKTEMTSIRKMISGKLWVDTRKFTNRRNQCIPTGMYELFGNSLSKSASTIHAELCEYFLDPDNKDIRTILRDSMKALKRPYSSWITNLNNINNPCDEFVMYLLCRCYKRHVCLITAKRLICSFKLGNMTTFQKLRKCDNVLLWLGESRFAEMLPLQNLKGAGPLQEWTLASECVNHLHEKNIAAKRPRKPMSTTTKDIVHVASTTSPKGTKWKRTEIDYKQYHMDGTVSVKSPKTPKKPKIVPLSSGPSESQIASQEHISQERRHTAKRDNTLGTMVKKGKIKKEPIASTRITRISHKLVKEEPNIRMIHRKEKPMGPERIIHPSGKLCTSSNRGGFYNDELPDLPTVSVSQPTPRSGQTICSPPNVRRTSKQYRTCTPTVSQVPKDSDILSRTGQTTDVSQGSKVSDVLSGYISTLEIPISVSTTDSRVVQTARSIHSVSSVLSGYMPLSRDFERNALQVDASIEEKSRTETATQGITSPTTDQQNTTEESRVGTTNEKIDDLEQVELDAAIERNTELHLLLDDDHTEAKGDQQTRVVATEREEQSIHVVTGSEEPTVGGNVPLSLDVDRDQMELDAAETLLQLQSTDVDTEPDENEEILPVDAPKQDDFIKDMTEAEAKNLENETEADKDENVVDEELEDDDRDVDDAETVIYEPDPKTTTKSPPIRGQVTFKHYGIRRHSPRLSIVRKHRCHFCDKSLNSKKELNDHHRAKHTGVQCPTCHKMFPTADTYQRHRYIHRVQEQYKCDVCDKVLPFESDLKRHKKSHSNEKMWRCANANCNREFKRKADLELHAVVHSGIRHKCTELGCTFSSLDPRNVKRHAKKHTQEATIACTKCNKLFVFYMQMKRHRDQEH